MAGPLDGLRVVEIAHILAGPVCGMMLADLGADVIKVEPLPHGEPSRTFGDYTLGGESAPFMMVNRNKRGIAVDLKTDVGRDVMRRMLAQTDVVIENFRAGTMERLGLGYEDLSAGNPGLILCEISGYGRTGPMAELGGFDLIAQGYSGLMSITGVAAECPPVKIGGPITDITAGILGAVGVLAALNERQRTGRGQRVDTSLFEAGILHTLWHAAIALAGHEVPGPLGSAHPLTAPYEAFETADGWINIGASNQASWIRLLAALTREELQDDARFATNAGRLENRKALAKVLGPVLRERSTRDWVELLNDAGVPAGPVLSIKDMLAHPQTIAREMVTSVSHRTAGTVDTIGSPLKFDRAPAHIERGAPLFGEHTREVLLDAGLDDSDIDELVARGAVYVADARDP